MPANIRAELIFISLMMIVIFIICGVAMYFFAKTYRREMKEREERREAKRLAKLAAEKEAALNEQDAGSEAINGPSLDT